MQPSELIARAIRRERELAGLSLSALAQRAGLAKSTLSQLEAGKGNPNIETLWAIGAALQIPFSCLFETGPAESELVRAADGIAVDSEQTDFLAVLLSKCPPGQRRDLYRVCFHRDGVREAAAHPPGTLEHAFLCSGRLRLGPKGEEQVLEAGDYFRYRGDVAHSYEALSEEALLLLVMDAIH